MTAPTADLLAEKAPAALAAARTADNPHGASIKVLAAQILRDECTPAGGEKPALRDVVAAVDAALTQQTTVETLAPYVRQSGSGWIYRFPNGRWASVVAEAQPLRFEVASADGERATGLTADRVEALLIDIATRTRD